MYIRQSAVAVAVAGILGSGVAAAANVDIYISGASAQRNFWVKDLKNMCGVAGSAINEFDANLGQSPNPDFKVWQCTASATPVSPINTGDVVTLHYSAELGSEWGIAPGLGNAGVAGYPTTHLFLTNVSTGSCTATSTNGGVPGGPQYNCPGTSSGTTYDYPSDAVSGPGASFFAQHKPDIVAADVEPTKWNIGDNWAGPGGAGLTLGTTNIAVTALGNAPSYTNLSKLQGKGQNVDGQIFSVVLTNGSGTGTAVPGSVTNLSHQSIASIFQGVYTTWSEVPEVGAADTASGGTSIIVCRRDHGSGSQTSASIFSTGTECGLTNTHAFVSAADANFMDPATQVVENNTTSLVQSCVKNNPGAIGFIGLAPSGNYNTVTVDGVEVNAHNAAAGYYGFAYETWAWNVTGGALGAKMITRAEDATTLGSVLGTETVQIQGNNQFHVTTGNPVGYYALAINNAATNTVSGLNAGASKTTAAAGTPTEMFTKNGESCAVAANANGS